MCFLVLAPYARAALFLSANAEVLTGEYVLEDMQGNPAVPGQVWKVTVLPIIGTPYFVGYVTMNGVHQPKEDAFYAPSATEYRFVNGYGNTGYTSPQGNGDWVSIMTSGSHTGRKTVMKRQS